jgi:hypothetical protein
MEQEPGSSGKSLVQRFASLLAGWPFSAQRVTGDKVTRASPFSSQVEAGRVALVRAPWNTAFLEELEAFPHHGSHDDQVDAASAAFEWLTRAPRTVEGRLLCWPNVEDPGGYRALDGGREIFRTACLCGHGYSQHAERGGSCEACGCHRYRGHEVDLTDDEPDVLGWPERSRSLPTLF